MVRINWQVIFLNSCGAFLLIWSVAFAETLFAADKVALIIRLQHAPKLILSSNKLISNRAYAPLMENLITPHCDAETLATSLQKLDFKTVTLGDLTLTEMTFIVNEYRKLLGEGVYGTVI